MKLKTTSRRWAVLNYAVTEPNEWTTREIANDLDDKYQYIKEAAITLTKQGLVVMGERKGRARMLMPTPAGVEVLQQSLGL